MPSMARSGPTLNPLPEVPLLLSAVLVQARSGNFDELERWAERLRSGEVVVDDKFVAEDLYQRLATAYVTPRPSGSHGGLEGFYQGQFAFIDEWLKQKPDSVAARIVKARSYIDYAWDVRGGGFASEVPREAWQPFKDRLETAEDALNEAARLTPRDVCVFSSLVSIGKALGWERKKMERTIERGLQVLKKDFFLIDAMATNLLPRWGGAPGDLGKFAARMSERIQGEDGIYVYARIARLTQVAEVSLTRRFRRPSGIRRIQSRFHRSKRGLGGVFRRQAAGRDCRVAQTPSQGEAKHELCLLAVLRLGRSRNGEGAIRRDPRQARSGRVGIARRIRSVAALGRSFDRRTIAVLADRRERDCPSASLQRRARRKSNSCGTTRP